ncbi:conserved hypothetical protein [Coccidioides posadasii str. Silveira]|uniref:Uncharacterized protein n=1 Tax=Coccidioides posadasii (strain RMSCC 757 / Silveira) TaxID=443226 RepID=E9D6F0_COCPS|nr:conserved hypothetical protein [Coccidioides posadasii str. Silveira]
MICPSICPGEANNSTMPLAQMSGIRTWKTPSTSLSHCSRLAIFQNQSTFPQLVRARPLSPNTLFIRKKRLSIYMYSECIYIRMLTCRAQDDRVYSCSFSRRVSPGPAQRNRRWLHLRCIFHLVALPYENRQHFLMYQPINQCGAPVHTAILSNMALPDPSKGKKKVSTGLIPPFCEPGCVYQGKLRGKSKVIVLHTE